MSMAAEKNLCVVLLDVEYALCYGNMRASAYT